MKPTDIGDTPRGIADDIARIARPLEEDDELDPLLGLVGRSRIVLLGESTHGTREFYELRARLTRRLIAEHGFSVLAIDADWPDVLRVDRYIRGVGDDESADAALAGFERFPAWRWRNGLVADLVEWMHGYNRHRLPSERAGCYGLDLYAMHASIRAVLSYLTEVDPEAAARLRARYAGFDHAATEAWPVAAPWGSPWGDEGLLEEVEEVIEELVELQRRRAARSGRAPSGAAWFSAIQGTNLTHRADAYYRALVAGAASAFGLREVQLADTIDLISSQLSRSGAPPRIVVWAHNTHVADAREIGRRHTLGAVLRRRHPQEVAIVGFTTHGGTVSCAHEWDGAPEIEELASPPDGSWEQLFHATGVPRFMVTAPALRRVIGEGAERPHRAIGAVYRQDSPRWRRSAPTRLGERYDVVVHLDATTAIAPLPRAVPDPYDAFTHQATEVAPAPP
jgi:erythromycin esterase-like protein